MGFACNSQVIVPVEDSLPEGADLNTVERKGHMHHATILLLSPALSIKNLLH